MRADRLVSIMLLLETHPCMTVREFSKRLEVSSRTIQRDMEALSAAGIPVVASRGAGGGWSLLEPYRTNLTGLNTEEIMALFLNKPSQILADLGVYDASKAARLKLLAALPETARPYAQWIQESFYLDTSTGSTSQQDLSFLPQLEEAICERWQVRIRLADGEGELFEQTVCPLGLVAKGQQWYLAAKQAEHITFYRVTTLTNLRMTQDRFERPLDFNLALCWEQYLATENPPQYTVTVRIASQAFTQIINTACVTAFEHPDTEGWRTAAIVFEDHRTACQYLLGFHTCVEVLAPLPLREQIEQLAREIVAFYERSNLGLKTG